MISAAVIGCGVQGQLHLSALARDARVTVQAVCDVNGEALRSAQERFDVPCAFASYEELLERQPLDLVCICTMPNTHRSVAIRALESGANVLCEKPFAMNLGEAQEIAGTAARYRRLLTVGFNMRFMTAAAEAASAVERGDIGKPTLALGSLECGVPRWGAHLVKRIAGGGILAGSGVHMIDVVRWICGNPAPTSVRGFTTRWFPTGQKESTGLPLASWDGETFVDAHISFETGLEFMFRADARLEREGVSYWFELRGEDGALQFDPFADGLGVPADQSAGTVARVLQESVDRELADVVDALESDSPACVRIEDALVVQSLIDALYDSADTCDKVYIEPGPTRGSRAHA